MNLNFSANMAGFCRDSHNCQIMYAMFYPVLNVLTKQKILTAIFCREIICNVYKKMAYYYILLFAS